MSRNLSSNEAYLKRKARREALFKKYPKLKEQIYYDSEESIYSEWWMRRMAPFGTLIHIFTIFFLFSWLLSLPQDVIYTTYLQQDDAKICQFKVDGSEKLINFQVKQVLEGREVPKYSELEVELLGYDYDHLYSVYKDLWLERHSDEDGVSRVYSDQELNFWVEVEEPGFYNLRAISHNNNSSEILIKVSSQGLASTYFFYSLIFFGSLSGLLILLSGYLGSPADMFRALRKIKSVKRNYLFIFVVIVGSAYCILIFVMSFAHYGYAKVGREKKLPGFAVPKNEVIYIG